MTRFLFKNRIHFSLIKPCDIEPDAHFPRKFFDDYELSLLSDSIKHSGIIEPLSVRPGGEGKYVLISGERRLRAAITLGLKRVPCIIHHTNECEAAYLSIIENLQRSNLTIFEEAEGINNLLKRYGAQYSDISERLGLSQTALLNKLEVLELDKPLRERIVAARLSERHARALLRLPNERQSGALDKIIAEAYTIRECEKYIETLLNEGETPPVKLKTSIGDIRLFANSLSRNVDTLVSCGINAKQEKIEGKDYIEYRVRIRNPKKEEKKESPIQLTIC